MLNTWLGKKKENQERNRGPLKRSVFFNKRYCATL